MPIDDIPSFDRQSMARLVMDLYGIEGEISPLVSYEDQNALIKTPAAKYVLKIANKKWPQSFVQAQTDVLEYLKINAPGLSDWRARTDRPCRIATNSRAAIMIETRASTLSERDIGRG